VPQVDNISFYLFHFRLENNPVKSRSRGIILNPSSREVISLRKMDSLTVVLNVTGAKKVSCDVMPEGFR
jgi:hypothetical protein